jgi:hypothetical protein
MKSIDKYGAMLVQLSKFTERLDEAVRSEAFKFLLAQELGGVSADAVLVAPQGQRPPAVREIAPQEVIRRSGRGKLTEKAVVLGFWLETHAGKESFSSGDLKAAFETAREKAPKNASDIVAALEQTGRLMRAAKLGGAQHYRLTGTALQEVEGWLATSGGK